MPLVRRLIKEKGVAVTRGATESNRLNLSPRWLATMGAIYDGTRLGRQELDGELLDDVEGALWSRELIERCRVDADSVGKLARAVIGVDPPASAQGDACGIVVAALLRDGRLAVVEDSPGTRLIVIALSPSRKVSARPRPKGGESVAGRPSRQRKISWRRISSA